MFPLNAFMLLLLYARYQCKYVVEDPCEVTLDTKYNSRFKLNIENHDLHMGRLMEWVAR